MHDPDRMDANQQTEQTLADGRFLRMVKRGRWEYVVRPNTRGAVAVIAVTDNSELILVEQHRVPLGKPCIELPAGLAGDLDDDPNETFAQAAGRELLEETGYRAAHLQHLFTVATSPGLTNETIDLYRATGVTKQDTGGGIGHEEITVHLIPVAEAADWLAKQAEQGKAVDVKTWLGVAMVSKGSS